MPVFRRFAAVRPAPTHAEQVAALPYDVMSSAEARVMVEGNPYSFLHVDRAEIDLDPSVDIYSPEVYAKANDTLQKFIADGVLITEEKPCLYIYKQVMDGRAQLGLVGCASIDDYLNNVIKKHEFTRADKEADRIRHVDVLDANTGPIFLTYHENPVVTKTMEDWVSAHDAVYDVLSDDGIRHTIWVIDCDDVMKTLEEGVAGASALYIADGHHRAASGVRVGCKRREEHPGYTGDEEFNYFLSVLFPDSHLHIMDYNRVVKDLNGNTPEAFMQKLEKVFMIEAYEGDGPLRPEKKHTFGLYLGGKWYRLTTRDGVFDPNSPTDRLDVAILQKNVLEPILGIMDPRTDTRIDFIGGIRGLGELERRCSLDMMIAFSMYPTTMDDLMSVADIGEVMPPKSTWFEPKLRSGFFVHKLEGR